MTAPRTLVLGRNGQLASHFRLARESDPQFHFLGHEALGADLEPFIARLKPSIVINCAAYTAVDKAESDHAACLKANRELPARLARASADHGFHLIHYSTDYVFDGTSRTPYRETDPVNPVNFYGRSKLEGEIEIQKAARSATIVRTSWVYSRFGHNFVKTMLRVAQQGTPLKVVADQIGCPTWAGDLASWTLDRLMEKTDRVELFHLSGEGETSWHGFAEKILQLKGIETPVKGITTAGFPTPAKRPAYSVLSKEEIKKRYAAEVAPWEESLARCLADWESA